MPRELPTEASIADTLRAAGCVWAEEEAALLVQSAHSPQHLAQLVSRRCSGEPIELLTGWAQFCGLRVMVTPGVFIPRRRTELLAREALKTAKETVARKSHGTRVLDMCCGSGAIALTVCAHVPEASVSAADVAHAAVACARQNLRAWRCDVWQGDLFSALPENAGPFDVIAANVPYVPTADIATLPAEARDHEPRVTLDGGADGLDLQRRLLAEARAWLAPGGRVLMETSRHQLRATQAITHALGYRTRVVASEELEATVVVARRH